jgi:hypothetical protein
VNSWWENVDLVIPDQWLDSFKRYRRKVPILFNGSPHLLLLECFCGAAWFAPAGVPCRGCGEYLTQEQVEQYAFSRLKQGLAALQRADGRPYLTKKRKKRVY